MAWTKQQVVAGNNGAAAATTVAVTLAGTQAKSELVAFLMIGVAGASITPPASWIQQGSSAATNPAGGTLACFILPWWANPGGITTVTFTISSALASMIIYELVNPPVITGIVDFFTATANANGTASSVANPAGKEYGEAVLVAVGYINTAALTLSNVPLQFTQDATTIGTAGAANAGLICLSAISSTLAQMLFTGVTLSGTPTDGPTTAMLAVFSFQLNPTDSGVGPLPLLQGENLLGAPR